MNLKSENYKSLFKMNGRLTCLHSEFFVMGSLGIDSAVVVCKENDWRSFISHDGEKLCSQKGYELFSSESAYQEYSNDFRAYIEMAKKDIIPRFSGANANVTIEEFKGLLPVLAKFWYLYGITEFSYHDLAYEKSLEMNDSILKKNLDDLGKLKFEGRELLNSYVFEDGVLHNLLQNIGKQFLKNKDDAAFLFSNELIDLFSGKNVDDQILNGRKECYGCASANGAVSFFSQQEALDIWNDFCDSKNEREIIKGTIANKGVASGTVVIAPMLVDMREIMKIDARMKEGAILVAESTTPELMMLCKKAAAIVTDQGGMLSHAAIVSRELNIPCIIGTGNATKVLHDGDIIEVDATKGIVKVIR